MTRTLEHLSTRRQTCSSATLSQTLVYGRDMDRNRVTEVRRLNYEKDRDRQCICQHISAILVNLQLQTWRRCEMSSLYLDKTDVR